jgi:hypothetical protein
MFVVMRAVLRARIHFWGEEEMKIIDSLVAQTVDITIPWRVDDMTHELRDE